MLKTTNLKNISKTAWNSVSIKVRCQGLYWTLDEPQRKERKYPSATAAATFTHVENTDGGSVWPVWLNQDAQHVPGWEDLLLGRYIFSSK